MEDKVTIPAKEWTEATNQHPILATISLDEWNKLKGTKIITHMRIDESGKLHSHDEIIVA